MIKVEEKIKINHFESLSDNFNEIKKVISNNVNTINLDSVQHERKEIIKQVLDIKNYTSIATNQIELIKDKLVQDEIEPHVINRANEINMILSTIHKHSSDLIPILEHETNFKDTLSSYQMKMKNIMSQIDLFVMKESLFKDYFQNLETDISNINNIL